MLCFSGFELYSRWVLLKLADVRVRMVFRFLNVTGVEHKTRKNFAYT